MYFIQNTVPFKLHGKYSPKRDLVVLERSAINIALAHQETSEPIYLKVISVRPTVTQEELDVASWSVELVQSSVAPGKSLYSLVFDGQRFMQALADGWPTKLYPLYRAILYSGKVEITVTDSHSNATHMYVDLSYGPAV